MSLDSGIFGGGTVLRGVLGKERPPLGLKNVKR